eukprot:s1486_g2.t1
MVRLVGDSRKHFPQRWSRSGRSAAVEHGRADLQNLCGSAGMPIKQHGVGKWKADKDLAQHLMRDLGCFREAGGGWCVFVSQKVLPVLVASNVRLARPGHLALRYAVSHYRSAFAAILVDGSVVTSGCFKEGGDGDAPEVHSQLQNRRKQFVCSASASKRAKKYSTYAAFAALLSNGSVVAWGNPCFGGDSSPVQQQLQSVQRAYANGYAFAAIMPDSCVATWGEPNFGGYLVFGKGGDWATKSFSKHNRCLHLVCVQKKLTHWRLSSQLRFFIFSNCFLMWSRITRCNFLRQYGIDLPGTRK